MNQSSALYAKSPARILIPPLPGLNQLLMMSDEIAWKRKSKKSKMLNSNVNKLRNQV